MQNKASLWRFGANTEGELGRQSQSGPFRLVLAIVPVVALAAGAGERVRLERGMLINLSGGRQPHPPQADWGWCIDGKERCITPCAP